MIDIDYLNTFNFNIPNNLQSTSFYNQLIVSATAIIENYVGMSIKPTELDEYYEPSENGKIILRYKPVIEVVSLKVGGKDTSFRLDNKSGIVKINGVSDKEIEVVYKAGFSTIPEDLKYACAELVQYLQKRMSGNLVGETSKNIDGGSISLESSMPVNVVYILNRYKWGNAVCVL